MTLFNKLFKRSRKSSRPNSRTNIAENEPTTAIVLNKAGGEAYDLTNEMKLVSILLTSMMQDAYYRSAKETLNELVATLPKVNAEFAAKAAIYARTKFGMRSISHVLTGELAPFASGKTWAKAFYDRIVYRPDDMLEILAYYKQRNGNGKIRKIPNAMRKGFAAAFDRFDGYQIAKYRGERHEVKLVDVVNLVHPIPTERNEAALKALIANELKSVDTWEARLTEAGQLANTDKEKAILKAAAWRDLIERHRLGYFALLRNLRNIKADAPKALDAALEMLVDKRLIKKSLVLPFRYLTAYKQFNDVFGADRKIRKALNKAIEISCANIPKMENTLVAIDNSGSMQGACRSMSGYSYVEIAAIFGILLAKRSNADLMEFGTTARYINYDLDANVLKFGQSFSSLNKVGHGTNFHAIFEKVGKRRYDRIIILSDMQAWMGTGAPMKAHISYMNRSGANPYIYSIDLAGLGSIGFHSPRVLKLAGFSEKIFDTMKNMELDRHALIREIEDVVI